MLKRSLVFSSPANLSLKDRQIVISLKESPEDKITVPIEDIGVVIIDNPAVSITIPLLNYLVDNNVILKVFLPLLYLVLVQTITKVKYYKAK